MMNFAALDVETANPDMASICQIGIAIYENGSLVGEWKTLIDPGDYFHAVNVSIHGINAKTVIGAPKLYEVAQIVCQHMGNRIVVCHTHFDRAAIRKAFAKHSLTEPCCTWLDSARVVRRAWTEFAWGGYGLTNVCETLGYKFAHHDALEDAKAAAQILLAAITRTGIDLEGWLRRVEQPINLPDGTHDSNKSHKGIARDGNPEGQLYGEVLVFTCTFRDFMHVGV